MSLKLLKSVGKHFRLAELTKQLQSLPKTKSRDFTAYFPDCETQLYLFSQVISLAKHCSA